MRSISFLLVLSLAVPPAAADEAAPPAPAAAVTPDAPAADAQSVREARRERFGLHRSVGYLTGALQFGSLVFFGLEDNARFGNGDRGRSYLVPEIALSSAAEVGVIVNYLLAATAPSRPGGTSMRNVVHQSLMYASAAANIARIIIGIALAGTSNPNSGDGLVVAHRITAIASPVLFAAAASIQAF